MVVYIYIVITMLLHICKLCVYNHMRTYTHRYDKLESRFKYIVHVHMHVYIYIQMFAYGKQSIVEYIYIYTYPCTRIHIYIGYIPPSHPPRTCPSRTSWRRWKLNDESRNVSAKWRKRTAERSASKTPVGWWDFVGRTPDFNGILIMKIWGKTYVDIYIYISGYYW